jgi:magnesium-transporting ATPase (P-type)
VLGLCTSQLNADGTVIDMSPSARMDMEAIIQKMATNALRTICFAYNDIDPSGKKIVFEFDGKE